MLRADDKIELRQPGEQRLCIGKITRCLAKLDAAADDDPAVGRAVGARKGLLPRGEIVLPVGIFARAVEIYMVRQA